MTRYFSPIPGRAGIDTRLTGTDMRVLGIVANYGGFGRPGCDISTRDIAAKLGAHQPNVAKAIRRLVGVRVCPAAPAPDARGDVRALCGLYL